ncbi:MAG: arylsulfatase, partial [Bacteroidaceae bacterium]|nr:arylsulfatase [Bacteroidaceae bacterium]
LDSENLLSTFLGKSRRARREMIVEAAGRLAYRCGRYALIPPYRGARRNATGNELGVVSDYTLYDLQADPSQHLDITATHPRLLRKFRRRFLQLVGDHYQENRQQEALK